MQDDTKLVHLARGAATTEGSVNLPVYRASTILSPNLASYLLRHEGKKRYENVTYGATGTQNSRALAGAVAELEGGKHCVITASGLSAVTFAISAFVGAGDHLLVTDSAYGPTRRFCSEVMRRYGVEVDYYDPRASADQVRALIRPNTRLLYLEAPGSLTFEMQDVPALAALAREQGILSAMDNTWATPLGFRPLEHGVDLSIQAGTKYIAGHSDLVIGMISSNDDAIHERLADHVMTFGDVASPDDCYLTLRGMRTLGVRLRQQYGAGLEIATWLEAQPEVKRVLYPPLASDPGHALFARDFSAGASLFGLALETTDMDAVHRMVDGLTLFPIGSSWGGYESLVAMNHMPVARDHIPWVETPYLLRLHIGLESPEDLMADLRAGLDRLSA
ncbi:MAG: cystathionine beta-lyase [Gammaproteobacteria bacterium]|jgi:cystathionine beta-lyase